MATLRKALGGVVAFAVAFAFVFWQNQHQTDSAPLTETSDVDSGVERAKSQVTFVTPAPSPSTDVPPSPTRDDDKAWDGRPPGSIGAFMDPEALATDPVDARDIGEPTDIDDVENWDVVPVVAIGEPLHPDDLQLLASDTTQADEPIEIGEFRDVDSDVPEITGTPRAIGRFTPINE